MRDTIKYLFPDILDSQFTLQDDGAGPYIKTWTYPQPKPTQAQIDAVSVDVATLNARKAMIVSRFQARAALLNAGLLDAAEAHFSDPATARIHQEAWNQVLNFYRISPLLESTGAALNLTETQLDDLFIAAANIQV